jgi:predicted homoserine dehydrogenase-like protein
MIIVDQALEKRHTENNPIRIGMIGAGFMAQGIALQMNTAAKGMKLVAISNRTIEKAEKIYIKSGIDKVVEAKDAGDLSKAIRNDIPAITGNPDLLCEAEEIDVIIEVTGAVEFSANVVLNAIRHKKHVVMMNAELDGTVGPILKVYADKQGVTITNADGDQPGVIMNLYRFVRGIGVTPVLCGNIKGLQDPYRNPTTQEGFAKKWGQNPSMVTSFADGSKISFEQTVVANATRMSVGKRGMYGPTVPAGTPISEAISEYPDHLLETKGGVVDYIVGAAPGPGVFVIGTHDHPLQKHYLNLYKLGEGPYYCFYTPYHLCHFEVPNTVARAALFQDAATAPVGRPYVDVVSIAKKDLKKGETLDAIGHYMTYGECENSDTARSENLLPLGAAEGCVLKKDIRKDQAITYDDVEVPDGRLIDQLLKQQNDYFFKKITS